MHAAVSGGWVGLTASWCLQHVLYSFAQSHTVVTQSGGSMHVLQPQFAPWTEVSGWGKPRGLSIPLSAMPFAQPGLLCREEPGPGGTISNTSPTVSQQAGSELGTPDLGLCFLPPRMRRAPNPWLFPPGSCCQPLPGMSLSCLFCGLQLVTSPECHRSDIATI